MHGNSHSLRSTAWLFPHTAFFSCLKAAVPMKSSLHQDHPTHKL